MGWAKAINFNNFNFKQVRRKTSNDVGWLHYCKNYQSWLVEFSAQDMEDFQQDMEDHTSMSTKLNITN